MAFFLALYSSIRVTVDIRVKLAYADDVNIAERIGYDKIIHSHVIFAFVSTLPGLGYVLFEYRQHFFDTE
jgi:hypothetical protein